MGEQHAPHDDLVVRSIHRPDRSRTFLDGSVRVVVGLDGVALGHGVYRSGWQWSRHVGPLAGRPSQAHVGYVLSGRLAVRHSGGTEVRVGPDEAFAVGAGHDAWTVGDQACVALDWSPRLTD